MNVRAAIAETEVRLLQPIPTARGLVGDRPSLVLELRDAEGNVGRGEVAPLPGWSTVSFDRARAELTAWLDALPPDGAGDVAVPVRVASAQTCAAVDAARWNLRAAQSGRPLWQELRPAAHPGSQPARVAVNALLASVDASALAAEAAAAEQAGHTTLKLKLGVGGGEGSSDRARIAAVAEAIGAETMVRLDANAAFEPEQGASVALAAQGLLGARLEYVEDPVSSLESLHDFRRLTDVAVAVDELVRTGDDLATVIRDGLAAALVVKPALMGGCTPVLALAERARSAGVGVVVSSTYDGPVGLRSWCHLAYALSLTSPGEAFESRWAHGLGTASLLKHRHAAALIPRNGRVEL